MAHVFKVSVDPYVGKLGIFRVHQGTVRPGSQLFVGDARKPFKIAHLYKLMGKDTREVPEGIPGDICAVAKVEELHFDAVLHDSHDEDEYHLKSDRLPAGHARRRASSPSGAVTSSDSPMPCTSSLPKILASASSITPR